jgi:hypothetical protein
MADVPPAPAAPTAPQPKTNVLGLTAEQVLKLVELGVLDDETADLLQQREMAEIRSLRRQPEGRDTGRVYVAASPLEHIGHYMQYRRAEKEKKTIKDDLAVIRAEQAKRRGQYADILLGGGTYGGTPPAQMPPRNMGPPP